VDSTRFHVHGVYGSGEEGQTVDAGDEPRAIRLTHGYSRDHRPDLQQWAMNLVCADSGGSCPPATPRRGVQGQDEALPRLGGLTLVGLWGPRPWVPPYPGPRDIKASAGAGVWIETCFSAMVRSLGLHRTVEASGSTRRFLGCGLDAPAPCATMRG